jgi:hypothetical protein
MMSNILLRQRRRHRMSNLGTLKAKGGAVDAVRILVVAVCCFGLGCSSSAGHVAKPTPTIVVLEPGVEPRQRVRYEPALDLVEEVEATTKLRISNTFTNTTLDTGQRLADLPSNVIRGRLRVTGRSPEGHALVSFAVEDVRTLEDVVDPALRHRVDAQVRRLKDARATWRMLPSGELTDVSVEMPNAPGAIRDRISALSDGFEEMFVRFPEADIGVGAIWQIASETKASGVTWTRKATYTLRELTDGQAIVDVSVALRAPSQTLRVEPNATTRMTSGTGTTSGQAFVPRHGLVISGSSTATTETNFLIVRGRLRIASTIRTEMLSSAKRIDTAADRGAPSP